jgi:hypothetical protein
MATTALAQPDGDPGFNSHVRPLSSTCDTCKAPVGPGTTHHHPRLGRVCSLCFTTCERLVSQYRAAASRHELEFYGQLKQMVLDVRGGADEPTFYRGEIS